MQILSNAKPNLQFNLFPHFEITCSVGYVRIFIVTIGVATFSQLCVETEEINPPEQCSCMHGSDESKMYPIISVLPA